MIANIEKIAENFKTESRLLADRAVAGLRQATLETAGLLAKSKAPVRTAAETGLKLNSASHKGIEKFVKAQVGAFEDLVDGGSRRLQMAARAKTLKALFEDQVATLPAARDTAIGNARKTVEIVRKTGDEVTGIVRGAIEAKPARKAPVRKAGARKAATRKAPVRKTGAKKAATRKAPARKAPARKASMKKAA